MPSAIVVAGPNGSGKSTLIRQLRADARFEFPRLYINADDIARSLPAQPQAAREQAAFHEARRLRQVYREKGLSFAFETVFSHPSNLMDLLRLKRDGYTTTLVFVTTSDVEVNVGRVAARVQEGGHSVPEEKVRDRYARSLRFLPRGVEIADRTFVYDSTDETRLVALVERETIYPNGPLPEYLRHCFSVPLFERRRERQEAKTCLIRGDTLVEPDEESEVCMGDILHLTTYYALQAGRNGTAFLHDRMLLHLQTAANLRVGAFAEIRYQSGYGTVAA